MTYHLAARSNAPEAAIAWTGYLGALVEWGLLDNAAHARLAELLPKGVGIRELGEILVGSNYDHAQHGVAI